MTCEISFHLSDGTSRSIADLRRMADSDPALDLGERLKGGKMKIIWPHTRPEPTGEVRAKLIHDRMHKKDQSNIVFDGSKSQILGYSSTIFTLIITIPCVAFSLYKLLSWFGYGEATSRIVGIVGGVASFFVELILLIIQAWKDEKRREAATNFLKFHVD